MKKQTIIIIGITALVTTALIILAKRRKNKRAVEMLAKTTTTVEFPLKMGSRGENVKKLQTHLNTKIPKTMVPLKIDGIFGVLTEAALKAVTGKTSITQDEFNKMYITT